MSQKKDLSIKFLGVDCENPFFLSSSPVCNNAEMVAKAFDTGWGGVFFKTVGIYVADECSPRFDILGKGTAPWGGFKNMEQISEKDVEANCRDIRELKKNYPHKIMGVSIMGSNDKEWTELARDVTAAGADILELNFSCPQMTSHAMGSDVGQNPELVYQYTKTVAEATHLPVVAKMTPNIGNMEKPAVAAFKGGAKGISAINTLKSITNLDITHLTGRPVVNGKSSISGYSGQAVKPVALRFIANLAQCADLAGAEISGIGGIETWQDALEFMLLGARNVQVTTAVMQYGYRIVEDMINGMQHFMAEHRIDRLDEIVGRAVPNIIPAEQLDRTFKIVPRIDDEKCVGCGRCYVSCFDGAHQAIDWDAEKRKPTIDDEKCVGCHLCLNVCPVEGCITPGKVLFKPGRDAGRKADAIRQQVCYR